MCLLRGLDLVKNQYVAVDGALVALVKLGSLFLCASEGGGVDSMEMDPVSDISAFLR